MSDIRSEELTQLRHVAYVAEMFLAHNADRSDLTNALNTWLAAKRQLSRVAFARGGVRGGTSMSLKSPSRQKRVPGDKTWLSPFGEAWRNRYGGSPNWGQLARALKEPVGNLGEVECLRRFKNYLAAVSGQYANVFKFAATLGEWSEEKSSRDPTVIRPGESLDAYQTRLAAL